MLRSPQFFVFRVALVILLSSLITSYSPAQDAAAKRRVVEQSAPAYPTLARAMALQGIVRVEAVVSADGSVRTVDVKGGHPVLAQAAVNAVRRWRWEPATHESREPVEVKFAPN